MKFNSVFKHEDINLNNSMYLLAVYVCLRYYSLAKGFATSLGVFNFCGVGHLSAYCYVSA